MQPARRILAAAALVGFGMSVAYAVDQTILGDSLQVKNPSTADKRKVLGKAKEKASTNTLVGDPTIGGATLTIRANGGAPNSQSFNLPTGTSPTTGKPFWSGDSVKGFKYKDPKYDNGPIKGLIIKKSGSGTFQIKATGLGKVQALSLLPPNPGTDGCMLLQIGGGDSYSVQYGPLDGIISNKGTLEYKHKKPSGEGTCITTTTSSSSTTSSSTSSTTSTSTTSTSSTTVPPCSPANFDFGITAFVSATLRNWPGGSQFFGTATCNVTVAAPSGNISNLSGDTWAVTSSNGFSSCGLAPQFPTCNSVGATSNVLGNGRPYCSNSSDVFASGPSTAHVFISCVP
jgi:hypothetical protein